MAKETHSASTQFLDYRAHEGSVPSNTTARPLSEPLTNPAHLPSRCNTTLGAGIPGNRKRRLPTSKGGQHLNGSDPGADIPRSTFRIGGAATFIQGHHINSETAFPAGPKRPAPGKIAASFWPKISNPKHLRTQTRRSLNAPVPNPLCKARNAHYAPILCAGPSPSYAC